MNSKIYWLYLNPTSWISRHTGYTYLRERQDMYNGYIWLLLHAYQGSLAIFYSCLTNICVIYRTLETKTNWKETLLVYCNLEHDKQKYNEQGLNEQEEYEKEYYKQEYNEQKNSLIKITGVMSRYYKTMIRVTFSKIVKLEEALRTGALCIFMDIGRCQQEHFQRHISSRNKTKRTKSFYSGTGTSGLHGRHLVT
jgi:hypothetical protein